MVFLCTGSSTSNWLWFSCAMFFFGALAYLNCGFKNDRSLFLNRMSLKAASHFCSLLKKRQIEMGVLCMAIGIVCLITLKYSWLMWVLPLLFVWHLLLYDWRIRKQIKPLYRQYLLEGPEPCWKTCTYYNMADNKQPLRPSASSAVNLCRSMEGGQRNGSQ